MPLNAKECPPFHHWVKPHHRSAYTRSNGTQVTAAFVDGHCRVNQKSFANWSKSFSIGPIKGWPHKSEKMKTWAQDEIELVLETIDHLPKFLTELPSIKLYRSSKSETKGNHGTNSKNIIVLYDSALKNEKLLKRVLIHELAHQYFLGLSNIEATLAGQALGWDQEDFKWTQKPETKPLLPDSSHSFSEAYSNAIELYFTSPTRLRAKSKQVYDWINIEYGDKIK